MGDRSRAGRRGAECHRRMVWTGRWARLGAPRSRRGREPQGQTPVGSGVAVARLTPRRRVGFHAQPQKVVPVSTYSRAAGGLLLGCPGGCCSGPDAAGGRQVGGGHDRTRKPAVRSRFGPCFRVRRRGGRFGRRCQSTTSSFTDRTHRLTGGARHREHRWASTPAASCRRSGRLHLLGSPATGMTDAGLLDFIIAGSVLLVVPTRREWVAVLEQRWNCRWTVCADETIETLRGAPPSRAPTGEDLRRPECWSCSTSTPIGIRTRTGFLGRIAASRRSAS